MAEHDKKIDKGKTFLERFNELYNKNYRTQAQLAEEVNVSRPTVSGWLKGSSTPDIQTLVKMTQLFGVSADYLLGLSDTASPDVTVRAAMEYTGLSEEAVEWLHIGIDDFECDGVGLSEEEKKENLAVASKLIQNRAFTNIIHQLSKVEKEAYMEQILTILEDEYSDCDLPEEDPNFRYAHKEDRKVVETNYIHVLKTKGTFWNASTADEVRAMDDDELACNVFRALLSAKDENELRQFHAAKAFTGYIDQLIAESCEKAERRFEGK